MLRGFQYLLILTVFLSAAAYAETQSQNTLDELNPFDPNIEQILNDYDQMYEDETGLASHLENGLSLFRDNGCFRQSCAVWVQVVKSTQVLYLYENASLVATWKVSTGLAGHTTPNFDTRPNGRIYDRYTSTRFPGGDYKGLGNMPYAVFIRGGFAIHGTAQANWSKLGQRASHGCVRVHPENAFTFNRLVRRFGVQNVWITIQD